MADKNNKNLKWEDYLMFTKGFEAGLEHKNIIGEPCVYDSNFKRIAERSLNHQSLTKFVYTHRYIFALAYSLLLVGIGLGLR